jgi:hypothetical protein
MRSIIRQLEAIAPRRVWHGVSQRAPEAFVAEIRMSAAPIRVFCEYVPEISTDYLLGDQVGLTPASPPALDLVVVGLGEAESGAVEGAVMIDQFGVRRFVEAWVVGARVFVVMINVSENYLSFRPIRTKLGQFGKAIQ